MLAHSFCSTAGGDCSQRWDKHAVESILPLKTRTDKGAAAAIAAALPPALASPATARGRARFGSWRHSRGCSLPCNASLCSVLSGCCSCCLGHSPTKCGAQTGRRC